jgi:hypothetical protein
MYGIILYNITQYNLILGNRRYFNFTTLRYEIQSFINILLSQMIKKNSHLPFLFKNRQYRIRFPRIRKEG